MGAMIAMGNFYENGEHGLSKNPKKAEELFKRAYDLGHPHAAYLLYELYSDSVPNPVLAMKYVEEGARRGNAYCMFGLAIIVRASGNNKETMRLYMNAARSGHATAMENVMLCYRENFLSKDDLATTLRAHQAANDVGKSEPREYAMRYVVRFK